MSSMGYTRREVEEALKLNKYDDIMATYLLLFKKSSEVHVAGICLSLLLLVSRPSQ